MRSLVMLVCVMVGSSLLSAQSSPPTVPSARDSVVTLPSVALPAALERVLRDYERAWQARDASGLAALFAADGFVLQPGKTPVRGRSGIEAAYAGQGGAGLRLRALAYAASDSVGFIIGAYRYGSDANDMGKFTLTLRRRPGGPWLIFSDMDNSSQAPRRPGGTEY